MLITEIVNLWVFVGHTCGYTTSQSHIFDFISPNNANIPTVTLTLGLQVIL